MLNAIPNNLDNPLYTEAVYGTRNMNTIAEAVNLQRLTSISLTKEIRHRLGIQMLCHYLGTSSKYTHASRLPMIAFPIPIHVDARPYFHPN